MYQPELATKEDMSTFHTSDYVTFLASLGSSNKNDRTVQKQLAKFAVGEDCPVFEGLWDFCQIYTSGSLGGAAELIGGGAEVAVNWSGGLHHAKKAEASGFCYINDCVLAILELLKAHQRVLYIDIDIHHGDGVEEAFYSTNRVMTLSFHKFGDYFPGTGAVDDTGCAVVSFFLSARLSAPLGRSACCSRRLSTRGRARPSLRRAHRVCRRLSHTFARSFFGSFVSHICLCFLLLLLHAPNLRVLLVSSVRSAHSSRYGEGEGYAVNVPLNDGMDDETYIRVFKEVVMKVMERFAPSAIVFQSGADSLAGDRLGCFNLSLKGHAAALAYVKSFGVPMLVLGGGGYTMTNVCRCWTYETAVLVGQHKVLDEKKMVRRVTHDE